MNLTKDWKKNLTFLLKAFKGKKQTLGLILGIRGDYITSYLNDMWGPSKETKIRMKEVVQQLNNGIDKRILIFNARKENCLNDYYGLVLSYIREKMKLTQKNLSNSLNIDPIKIQKLLGNSSIRKINKGKYNNILTKINVDESTVREAEKKIRLALDGELQWSSNLPSIILKINQFLSWNPKRFPPVVGFNVETSLNKGSNFEKIVFNKLNKNNDLYMNPVVYSADLEEYAFLDIIKLDPKPNLIEVKEVNDILPK